MEILAQEGPAGCCSGDGVCGVQQVGDNDHALSPGLEHRREIGEIDSPDAEDGEGKQAVYFLDLLSSDRRVVGFGCRRKEWAEAYVVRRFLASRQGLIERMSGLADNGFGTSLSPCFSNAQVILPHMGAIRPGFSDKVRMIVQDKGNASLPADWRELQSHGADFLPTFFLCSELKDIGTARNQRISHRDHPIGRHVPGVQDRVETTLGKLFHNGIILFNPEIPFSRAESLFLHCGDTILEEFLKESRVVFSLAEVGVLHDCTMQGYGRLDADDLVLAEGT